MVNRAGDDHGQANVVLGEVLVDGHQARLQNQDVVARFRGQQVDAAGNQSFDLGIVIGYEVVKRKRAGRLIVTAGFDVQRLVGRADAAGDEARLIRVAARVVVGGAAGQLGGRLIQLESMLLQSK